MAGIFIQDVFELRFNKRNTTRSANNHLYILLVAVLCRRPGVVVVVEAGLPWQPAVVVESGGRCDLVVADFSRLYA